MTAVFAISSSATPAEEAGKPERLSDVLFYCSFAGTVTPAIQKGEKGATPSGQIEFTKGLMGQALLTGHSRYVSYPARGNINVAEGTVKFWVMPVDWKPGDNLFHHFFHVGLDSPPPEGMKDAKLFGFLLYKFSDWDDVLAYGMNNELTADHILTIPMGNNWGPKQWHQIAFTWDNQGASLYIDGDGTSRKYLREAPNLMTAESFVVGGPYFVENKTLTAINELYIYNRKLSAEEIGQMYKKELVEGVMKR